MKFLSSLFLPLVVGGIVFCASLVAGMFFFFHSQSPEISDSIWRVSALLGLVTFALVYWLKRRDSRDQKGNHFQ